MSFERRSWLPGPAHRAEEREAGTVTIDFDWIPDTARARPFVVPCPACSGSSWRAAQQEPCCSEPCWLCCGHGSVARVKAERYERACKAKA